MATASPLYGTRTAITLSLQTGPLASDTNLLAGRESTAIDLESIDGVDVVITGKVTTGTTPTASRQIEVWAAALTDTGEYTGALAGTDGTITLTAESKVQMQLLTIMPTHATSDTPYRFAVSLMQRFGFVPSKLGIFVVHNTGVALNSTAGNHEFYYQSIKYESA